jgi:hypothetical protein
MSKDRFAVPGRAAVLSFAALCLLTVSRAGADPIHLAPGSVTQLDNLNADCQVPQAGSGSDCQGPVPEGRQVRLRVSAAAAVGFSPGTARSFGLFDFVVDAPGVTTVDVVTNASWSGFLTVTGDTVDTEAGVALKLQIVDAEVPGTPVVASATIHDHGIVPEPIFPLPVGTKTETDSGSAPASLTGVKLKGQHLYRVVVDIVARARTGLGTAAADYRTGSNGVVFDYPTVTVEENLQLTILDTVRRLEDSLATVDFRLVGLGDAVDQQRGLLAGVHVRLDQHDREARARLGQIVNLLTTLTGPGGDLVGAVDLAVGGDLEHGFRLAASVGGEPALVDLISVLLLVRARGDEQPSFVDVSSLAQVRDLGQGVYAVRLRLPRGLTRRALGLVQFNVLHEDGQRVGTAVAFADGDDRDGRR